MITTVQINPQPPHMNPETIAAALKRVEDAIAQLEREIAQAQQSTKRG